MICVAAMISLGAVVITFLHLTAGQNDVTFASMLDRHGDLATRISCQVEEAQHFQYSSVTELWGTQGGQIALNADVVVHCLGADEGGAYGNEALKYRAQISSLQMTEEKESDSPSRIRKKRGAKEFFTNSWNKVKQFFNRVFGRKTSQPDVARAAPDNTDTAKDADPEPSDSEAEEVFAIGNDIYSVPFQFVQLANGTIPEIRFSENEVEDGRIKNFKRHLVDAFSTQLDFDRTKKAIVETSVMGEHTSNYNITVTGESANLNIAGWVTTTEPHDSNSKVVVVKKRVTEKDIVHLSPSKAINDKNTMDLETQQMQVFKDGRMISSSGTSSLSLIADNSVEKGRFKRQAEDDATSYIQTHTSFHLELRRRSRRSTEEFARYLEEEKETSFRPSARMAEVDDSQEKRKLQELQESSNFEVILEDLLKGHGTRREKEMQALTDIIQREVNLKMDKGPNSVSSIVRRTLTLEKMKQLCSKSFSTCKDYLQLIALAGGSEAETIFLNFLRESDRPSYQLQMMADILSDFPDPSNNLLFQLSNMLEENSHPVEVIGSLSISVSHLASKREETKARISDIMTRMLLEKKNNCLGDASIIDLLEAVGNLKCERIITPVLQVSAACRNSSTVQIACTHALRHFSDNISVQEWMERMVEIGHCDVIKEVVGSLMDKIHDQEMTPDVTSWPRFGFNKIDTILRSYLMNNRCSMEDILLYFKRKKNSEANSIAVSNFGFESEAWETESTGKRQKRRALWDDLNCQEWTEDSKYTPIQGKDEFASDRATYNKRKSCLAFRKLGVKGANAEIYAGMFAGVKEPSDPPKYKLFTKFVSGINFLGHQVEIGSFYFYLHSGKTKAFVRIMGRTRQEFTNEGCTPTELRYRPLKHIPLYQLNVANVELSLGIHLSSKLSVDTECPEKEVYQLQPLTNARIGGEAVGTVLFIRGSANLGADFNYKLQFIFTPTPDMCLKGNHGFEPMNINFESYFQLWNSAKQDWGKTRVWKPSFLSWKLSQGRMKQWFDDTCVAMQRKDTPPKGLERELE